jgi:glycosyltransferase involved in cell wall biosynthesis
MLLELRAHHRVIDFNVAPHPHALAFIKQWFRFLFRILACKPESVYIALSGGKRQIIDLAFALVARICGVPIFVHHHTFSYLTKRRLLPALCLTVMCKATHIVLCECMGEKLTSNYCIDSCNFRVLSNAAFLEDHNQIDYEKSNKGDALRVGFLSNITRQKGIFEFFTVLQAAEARGKLIQGIIAGPIASPIKESFDAELESSKNAKYVGAVYGEKKKEFFSDIDILFFPSHLHEAEPVTILEALSYAIPVIAFSRGCIEAMLPSKAGSVFSYSEKFVDQVFEEIDLIAGASPILSASRRAAREAFETRRAANRLALKGLIDEMRGRQVSA